mgnify:FL=1
MRDVLAGAVAAAALIGAGIFLGRYVWGGPAQPPAALQTHAQPGETGPERNAQTATQPQPPPVATARPEDAAARREYEAIMAVLAGKPASLAPVKARLAELARKHASSEWGMLAGLKLAELAESERAARAEEYRRLLDKVAGLERRERFGEAAALLEKLPESLAGSEVAPRAAEEAAAVRKRAAERYEMTARRAERSVADGDLASAMLDYKRVVEDYGIAELAEAASRRMAELGRIQEQSAQEAARRLEEDRRKRAAKALRQVLETSKAHLVMFRYADALGAVGKVAADKDLGDDDRKLLAGYADLIRAEQKLFDLASRRVANGIRELNITVGDSEVLTIKKLDEKGLVAEGTGVSGMLFTWERINKSSLYQAYLAVKNTIDPTSAEEQLALATCAFHHDQEMERQNCLKVAGELDPASKDRASAQADIYRRVEAAAKAAPANVEKP